jgi:cell wall-associated NlpC family hydrolase
MSGRRISAWLIFGVVLLVLGGCAQQRIESPKPLPKLGLSPAEVMNRLQLQYSQWRGVPYRNGGQGKNGIDCSAFVQQTYREKFGLNLPRTTRQLATYGREIINTGLRPGDLVMFKTGWRDRHVGIYLEKYRFLHVSLSSGVTISSMTDPYWYDRYWQTRRVFN